MLIDWFTVIAQAVNFLLLVWLMKRFLYQPILKALDAREKRIAAELADADAKRTEASEEREDFRRKNDELDRQRAQLLSDAASEAAAERRRLLDEARNDAEALRAKLQESLSGEYQSLHDEIARRTRAEVFAMARKTLGDLSEISLEERMAEVFIRRLGGLSAEAKEKLVPALKSPGAAILLRSAFDLAPALRSMIESAVRAALAADGPIRFEVVPDLVSGIELVMEGRKIAWSISDYLSSLERDVNELLKARDQEKTAAGTAKSR